MNTGFLGTAVATVLTVYGIETSILSLTVSGVSVATVLTVYGIETGDILWTSLIKVKHVATVLTVYGIETECKR